jgi:hypothetical protein
MWWRRKKTRREELTEARDNVRRQIEVLEGGPTGGDIWASRSDTTILLEELRGVLADLNESLQQLGPDDA